MCCPPLTRKKSLALSKLHNLYNLYRLLIKVLKCTDNKVTMSPEKFSEKPPKLAQIEAVLCNMQFTGHCTFPRIDGYIEHIFPRIDRYIEHIFPGIDRYIEYIFPGIDRYIEHTFPGIDRYIEHIFS